jgi:1-acyl-sn-glycerol-3-phosphate acyltransferase
MMDRPSVRTGLGVLNLLAFMLCAWPVWVAVRARESGGTRARDARWTQVMCRWALRILHCKVETSGLIPSRGIVVANHLGYADIFAIGALLPSAFVAKKCVRRWPVFGWLASMAGTVFVDRNCPAHVSEPLSEIEEIVADGIPVVFFPEGTSTDGSHVLPFRSSLFAVSTKLALPTTPVTISYHNAKDDRPNRRLAYHGENHFAPHLMAALGAGPTTIRLVFGQSVVDRNRKELARRLHNTISHALGLRSD